MATFTIEEIKNYITSKDSLGDVLYYLSEENIIKVNEINKSEDERDYLVELDCEDDFIDIMTIEEFNNCVKSKMITNYDGSGYWVKDGYESSDEVFNSPQLDATHVAWYNK